MRERDGELFSLQLDPFVLPTSTLTQSKLNRLRYRVEKAGGGFCRGVKLGEYQLVITQRSWLTEKWAAFCLFA